MGELRQEMNLEKRLQIEEKPLGIEQVGGPEHTFLYSGGILYSWKVDGVEREAEIGKCSKPALKSKIEEFLKTPEAFQWYQFAFEINRPSKPELEMMMVVVNLRNHRKLTARYRVWGFDTQALEKDFDACAAKRSCGFVTYHKEAFRKEFAGDDYLLITADNVGIICEHGDAVGIAASDVVRKFHSENSSPGYKRELLRLYFGVNTSFSNKFDNKFIQDCKQNPEHILAYEKPFLRREKL